ncbi:MAG: YegP family protein [Deltaproteobacteria bacterium]|nr:YegP family protein [Deltaproteobacteria bacterium]
MRTFNSLIAALLLSVSSLTVGCATSGSDDQYSEVEDEAASAGKFSLWQSTDGQWRFNLKSGNGATLLTSEGYTTRTAAITGVLSVQDNGVDPAQYEVRQTETGFNVHLVAGNHESISFSQVYSTKASATRAITSCVKAVTSYLDRREATATGARVDIAQGETGKFHFSFFAKNGQNVLASESYESAAAAFNGAFAVQTDGQLATAYTIKENASGGFYFTVQALNGEVVGVSQQYTTRSGASEGVAALTRLLPIISVL